LLKKLLHLNPAILRHQLVIEVIAHHKKSNKQ
jgi:hypothetical protein